MHDHLGLPQQGEADLLSVLLTTQMQSEATYCGKEMFERKTYKKVLVCLVLSGLRGKTTSLCKPSCLPDVLHFSHGQCFNVLVKVVSFKYSLALYSVQIWLRFTATRRPFMTLLEKQDFIASAPDMGHYHPVSFPPFVIMQILIHSPHSTSFKTHQGCHQYSV